MEARGAAVIRAVSEGRLDLVRSLLKEGDISSDDKYWIIEHLEGPIVDQVLDLLKVKNSEG